MNEKKEEIEIILEAKDFISEITALLDAYAIAVEQKISVVDDEVAQLIRWVIDFSDGIIDAMSAEVIKAEGFLEKGQKSLAEDIIKGVNDQADELAQVLKESTECIVWVYPSLYKH